MDFVAQHSILDSLIAWYPFERGKKALCIEDGDSSVSDILNEKGLDVTRVFSDDFVSEDYYDYIVCLSNIEKLRKPEKRISELYGCLSSTGILMFPMRNRLGIRYFCGDRDPYTGAVFDGIDGYCYAKFDNGSYFPGRMYAKSEIEKLLQMSGVSAYKIYAVYSGLEYPSHLVADNYIPNEDLANRILPTYDYPYSVFLEEERLYETLIENGLFYAMANAFLIECALDKKMLSDALYVTNSLDRSDDRRFATLVHIDNTVTKRALHRDGEKNIRKLSRNLIALRQREINVVDFELADSVLTMPYVNAITGQKYLQELLVKDRTEFFSGFDQFMDVIDMSTDIAYNDPDYGPIAETAYIDMIPLNSFYTDGEYVFFDQEFAFHDYPINVVKARALFTFFAYHDENRFIEDELFNRYGLSKNRMMYEKYEWEFLKKLWNEDNFEEYRTYYRRDTPVSNKNRLWMNYPADFYRKCFIDIFEDTAGMDIYLFGSGKYANDFIERYADLYSIKGVFDNDDRKWEMSINGIEIVSPNMIRSLAKDTFKIFICIREYKEIARQLDKYRIQNYSVYDMHKSYKRKPDRSISKGISQAYHIGYCAGAFDMFHIGHLNLLRRAKERCDYLIVGVMSDERMYDLKKKYPVIPCNERMQVVAGCRYVDQVEELPADRAGIMDAYNMFHFDCMFSGDDHADDPGWLAERERLREHGSDIVFVSYTKETSSSAIREKMKKDADQVNPDDSRLLTDKNHRWIYTYDYAPDSVWEEWRSETGAPEWIEDEADAVAERVLANAAAEPGTDPDMDSYRGAPDGDGSGLSCYILLADSHFAYNGTWDDTVSSMRALCERIPIKGIIHLGDLTDGLLPLYQTKQIEDKVMSDMKSLGIPIHVVPGNHDYNYFRGNPEIRYPETPRYYVDDKGQKLRMCFIDSFDPKAKSRYGFTEDCIAWLDETLSMMPEGYSAIVFSHLPPLVRLQAWTADIRNRSRLIEVLDKYSEKIMAFINGHNHCDQLFNDLKNGQFPIISINCAKCEYFLEHKPEGAEVPFRRLGDRTQESFDVMQVYTDKNEIYFTRFGAGRDRTVKNHRAYRL